MNSYDEYLDSLRLSGLQELASGSSAKIFQHPLHENVVVRVFTQDDKGYRTWLKFVLRNPHNRFVPKIIRNERNKLFYYTNLDADTRMYLVFIKKYKPLTRIQWNDLMTLLYKMAEMRPKYYELESRLWWNLVDNPHFEQEFGDDGVAIARYLVQNSHMIDLHSHNIMYDVEGNGIIFTDPLDAV